MALYTITLQEYLKQGGVLPPCFSDIPAITTKYYQDGEVVTDEYDFEKMFIDRYLMREIGFETPALFYQRLNGVAVLKVQEYKTKIELFDDMPDVLEAKRVDKLIKGTTDTLTSKVENFVGAFNDTTGEATPANKTNETKGTSSTTGSGTDTHEYSGASESERLSTLERLTDLRNIYERLLDEFDGLFMGIF